MKFLRLSLLLATFSTILLLWSCGQKAKEESKTDEFNQANADSADSAYVPPIKPSEIPYLLQATGAEFNQTLINDRRKVDSYVTRNDKAALNLGIYASDIGYLTSYDKTQEAIDYLGAVKVLSDHLQITGTFDAEFQKEFEKHISNKDSLGKLIDKAILKVDDILRDDNRKKLAALMFTGSFIEGLYVSTGVVRTYPKDLPPDQRDQVLTPLMTVIMRQEGSVGQLLKILGTIDQAEPVASLVADLNLLQLRFKDLNEAIKKNNKPGLILSDKSLTEVTRIAEKLRKSVTD